MIMEIDLGRSFDPIDGTVKDRDMKEQLLDSIIEREGHHNQSQYGAH